MKAPAAFSIPAHLFLALVISYGLSTFFWLVLDVFNLTGFIFISALAAFLGLITGWLMGKKLWVTALATLLTRLGLYFFMMRGI